MVAHAAIPKSVPSEASGSVLTFIVPAKNGCNLNCAFCYIERRKEPATRLDLAPGDYVTFIEQIAVRESISSICIQGYEPLLPESFAYTRVILAAGQHLGVPTSLVTNGTHLERWIAELAALQPGMIAVSIDSADPAIHDKVRGKIGAFEDAMRGLRRAAEHPLLMQSLMLASVLMPRRHERLLNMPKLVAELGVKDWVVTVLSDVGKDRIGGPIGERHRTFADLAILKREAERHGVGFLVDDEFGTLAHEDLARDIDAIRTLRIRRLAQPFGVYRLLPTGHCSIGPDILMQLGPHTPRWHPSQMNACDFIEELR